MAPTTTACPPRRSCSPSSSAPGYAASRCGSCSARTVCAYGNAQAAGTISLLTLERFSDDVLGWHPRMLYGDAYDQATITSRP
jgi:hypothetical protein